MLSLEEAKLVVTLQLLIARAANSDSLSWWEDEALTSQGLFIFQRVFTAAPMLAARHIALVSASVRHQADLGEIKHAIHLYGLDTDNQAGLSLRDINLLDLKMAIDPITTMKSLEQHLINLLGEIKPYTIIARQGKRLQIELTEVPSGISSIVYRAATLACAYLEGDKGSLLIPYCMER